jgi:hypothetical protein
MRPTPDTNGRMSWGWRLGWALFFFLLFLALGQQFG